MTKASDREAILARRRRLVLAAMAGIGVAGCDKPQPCLSVIPNPPTATAPATATATASTTASAAPTTAPSASSSANMSLPEPKPLEPMVCLEIEAPDLVR